MHLKDYYAILEVEPSATVPEIKKSFRRLAQQYHPDKNQQDPYADAQFHAIKEAYEVLTNPVKKEYYLQQRWFSQSTGTKKKEAVVTPETILLQALELDRYVAGIDRFRMDKQGLEQYLLAILSDNSITQLKQFNAPDIMTQITRSLLSAMEPLPLQNTSAIIGRLQQAASGNEQALALIDNYFIKAKRRFLREKYSLAVIIVITIILCSLIFFAGR